MSRKIFVIIAIALSPLLLMVLASLFYSSLRKDRFVEKEVVEIKKEQARRSKGSLLTVATAPPSPRTSPAARAVPPSASPSPSPEPSVGVADLLRMVEEDDVCGLWLQGGLASLELGQLVSLMTQMRSFSALDRVSQTLLESHATNDPKKIEATLRDGNTDVTDFYDALLSGGLLSGVGVRESPPDLPRARDLLERLALRYPENAALTYYWLVAEKRLDAPPEQLDRIIGAMSRATRFDSFENLFARDVLEANLGSAAQMLVAFQLNSNIRTPNPSEVSGILQQRLPENPSLAQGLIELGKNIMDQEERNADGLEFVDWSQLNLVIGRLIAKMGWRYTEGNDQFPSDIDRDLKKIRAAQGTPGADSLSAVGKLHSEAGCDRSGVDETFRQIANRRRR